VWKDDLLVDNPGAQGANSGYVVEKQFEREGNFCLSFFQKKRKDSFDMSQPFWLKVLGLICWHCFFGCDTSKKLL
jgi:hypothetical protein